MKHTQSFFPSSSVSAQLKMAHVSSQRALILILSMLTYLQRGRAFTRSFLQMRWKFSELEDEATLVKVPSSTGTSSRSPRSLMELRAEISSVDDREAMSVYREALRRCKKEVRVMRAYSRIVSILNEAYFRQYQLV